MELGSNVKAYTSSKSLAKEVCFAMALAPLTADVAATYVKGFGWCIECSCDNRDATVKRLWTFLGNSKASKVNWV